MEVLKSTFLFLFILLFITSIFPELTLEKALYWKKIDSSRVQCLLCPRKCILKVGQRGVCGVRINKNGILYTLGYGNPVAVHVDPIEKKPFFHVFPGAKTLSLAVAGCNMRCKFCQNWLISQSKPDETQNYFLTPERIVDLAIKYKCEFIVFTYTEPTVFYEYMLDIAKLAKQKGLKTAMHTCGYINPEPLKRLLKYLDAVNVDLKGFNKEFYLKMGAYAELKPVLRTLKIIKDSGVWLEITNLIIPGQNDSPQEIEAMCKWIKENLGVEVPLHFSRFFPAYRLKNLPPTPVETLKMAWRIAKSVGLKYVYIGNLVGNPAESTYCPKCSKILIERVGYKILKNNIIKGKCKFCGKKIPGVWRDE